MSSGLAFAIPGRWTGGKREEDEMRRLMAKEAEAAKARGEILEETSASDWSSNEDENNKDISDHGNYNIQWRRIDMDHFKHQFRFSSN